MNEAERYKNEDEKQKNRIAAKNALESYCFHMKSTLEDEKLKDKISADDKKTITDKCQEVKEVLIIFLSINVSTCSLVVSVKPLKIMMKFIPKTFAVSTRGAALVPKMGFMSFLGCLNYE